MNELDRQAWLEAKRNYVGASEVATLFGMNPYCTPLRLWGLKTGRIPPDPENINMRLGTKLEPIIAEEYCLATGREVLTHDVEPPHSTPHRYGPMTMYSRDDVPLSCTPDRLVSPRSDTDQAWGTCQLKSTNPYLAHEWAVDDGVVTIPIRVQMQVQAEMAVLGCRWGSAAVLIGGCDFRWGDLELNDKFVAVMLLRADEFVWHVRHDKPPSELTGDDRRTLTELYPEECPGVVIDLPMEACAITRRLELAKAAVDENEGIVEHCKAQLQSMIGEAEKGILIDGSGAWTWKQRNGYEVKSHTVEQTRILRKVKAKP